MNRDYLKGHMKRYGDTVKTLSEYLGLHPHTLLMKMRDDQKQPFTQKEIQAIIKRYDFLTADDIKHTFFA